MSPHESTLVELLFDFMATVDVPDPLIGDKACDSDKLDTRMEELGVDLIAPHRSTYPLIPPRDIRRRIVDESSSFVRV